MSRGGCPHRSRAGPALLAPGATALPGTAVPPAAGTDSAWHLGPVAPGALPDPFAVRSVPVTSLFPDADPKVRRPHRAARGDGGREAGVSRCGG